jgi:hypothetical protein
MKLITDSITLAPALSASPTEYYFGTLELELPETVTIDGWGARSRLLPSEQPGPRAGHPITRAVTEPGALHVGRLRTLGRTLD